MSLVLPPHGIYDDDIGLHRGDRYRAGLGIDVVIPDDVRGPEGHLPRGAQNGERPAVGLQLQQLPHDLASAQGTQLAVRLLRHARNVHAGL